MTQPQDKMRAKFEVLRPDFESLPMFEIDKTLLQKNEEGDYVCEPVQGMWLGYGLAHAYPSAQSQQEALAPLTDEQIEKATGAKRGEPLFLVAKGFTIAVETAHGIKAIATQGASNV